MAIMVKPPCPSLSPEAAAAPNFSKPPQPQTSGAKTNTVLGFSLATLPRKAGQSFRFKFLCFSSNDPLICVIISVPPW